MTDDIIGFQMMLHLDGEPIRVLYVNRDSGIALCVFQNHTFDIPIRSLFLIADAEPSLVELFRVGVGSGDVSWNRASLISAVNDSGIFAPLTVGDLSKKPGKDVNPRDG